MLFNNFGVVPKWSKGAVCKTVIRRFESGRRLDLCPGGGIGRHKGLKIPRPLKPCRFDSGPGYYPITLFILLLQLFCIINIVVS